MPRYYDDLSSDGEDHAGSEDEDDIGPHAQIAPTCNRSDLELLGYSTNTYPDRNRSASSSVGQAVSPRDDAVVGREDQNEAQLTDDDRCILHLDVDFFYGQCEHIDRNIPLERPLAVGQKHIIATCNYAARAYGVNKLETRDEAYRKCPSLLIVEGSDLERYRHHSHHIYRTFRQACQRVASDLISQSGDGRGDTPNVKDLVAVSRGYGMDEMMEKNDLEGIMASADCKDTFVYGEVDSNSSARHVVYLSEDQTGEETRVEISPGASRFVHQTVDVQRHRRRLTRTCMWAQCIRQSILQATKFSTTVGVSVNPFLAKLAGGLKKPHSVNALYPWSAPYLVSNMPLRKIPGVGHRNMKVLRSGLERILGDSGNTTGNGESRCWTCQDLLRIPRVELMQCLRNVPGITPMNLDRHCDELLAKCQGYDRSTTVTDDDETLAQTISVEHSAIRGSVRTWEAIDFILTDLCVRALRLLQTRVHWSKKPSGCYPTAIRATVRSVVVSSEPKPRHPQRYSRPFETHSKQQSFDGRKLSLVDASGTPMDSEEESDRRIGILREAFLPLTKHLVFSTRLGGRIDVTRINIAFFNFQDCSQALKEPPPVDDNSAGVWISDTGCMESDCMPFTNDSNKKGFICPSTSQSQNRGFRETSNPKKRRIDQYFACRPRSAT
jgi:nucleotidyltransferase/DNA polymerase involved in DNA repair